MLYLECDFKYWYILFIYIHTPCMQDHFCWHLCIGEQKPWKPFKNSKNYSFQNKHRIKLTKCINERSKFPHVLDCIGKQHIIKLRVILRILKLNVFFLVFYESSDSKLISISWDFFSKIISKIPRSCCGKQD